MAELKWSERATADLEEICAYIARSSETTARDIAQQFHAAAQLLRDHPLIGSLVPEYERFGVRERLVQNYRMLYRVKGDIVTIAAIYRGARQLPRRPPK
jgi:addiction module RelE/StbE family toxin